MYVPSVDQSFGEHEWRPFLERHRFGHLIAGGSGLDYPVAVPTQFVLEGDKVMFHFASRNPVLDALAGEPRALLSVAADWAYVPSSWKAIGDEDPRLGIPTTYYAAVQLRGRARTLSDPDEVADVLRRQLSVLQPDMLVADPAEVHGARLALIRAVVLQVEEVTGKFKYGGNVDVEHRQAVVERLRDRGSPSDRAAADHVERRTSGPTSR